MCARIFDFAEIFGQCFPAEHSFGIAFTRTPSTHALPSLHIRHLRLEFELVIRSEVLSLYSIKKAACLQQLMSARTYLQKVVACTFYQHRTA